MRARERESPNQNKAIEMVRNIKRTNRCGTWLYVSSEQVEVREMKREEDAHKQKSFARSNVAQLGFSKNKLVSSKFRCLFFLFAFFSSAEYSPNAMHCRATSFSLSLTSVCSQSFVLKF